MISVVIPTYQHAKTIRACVESLLAQIVPPDELIVIDDGSTDETEEALKPFGLRVQYRFQTNHGASHARNAGAALASGDMILFCDADIQADPHLLEKLSQALREHPSASYAYSGFFWGRKRFRSRSFDPRALRRNNYIHTASLIRRSAFPGFDPALKRFQDWDVYLTMLENGQTGIAVPEELFRVLQTSGRKGMSHWLPSCFYQIPWHSFGWMPHTIRDYENAKQIVKIKHHLQKDGKG
jgi:glycosyltransferase involved in cell wall biosynthesis